MKRAISFSVYWEEYVGLAIKSGSSSIRLLLIIIGYGYGTVSVGGNLYLYDTVEQ